MTKKEIVSIVTKPGKYFFVLNDVDEDFNAGRAIMEVEGLYAPNASPKPNSATLICTSSAKLSKGYEYQLLNNAIEQIIPLEDILNAIKE